MKKTTAQILSNQGNIKFNLTGGMRLPAGDKNYWLNQLETFTHQFADMQILFVQYGKQDMRGIPSITLIDYNHCVPVQQHFKTSRELLAYVQGYNAANKAQAGFNPFAMYQKGAK